MNIFLCRQQMATLVLAGALVPLFASAETLTAPNDSEVTATVIANCPSVTVTPFDFGDHLQSNALLSGADAMANTATITVVCGLNTDYTIALNAGQHSLNGSVRRMKRSLPDSQHYLDYRLYQQAGAQAPWGERFQGVGNGTLGNRQLGTGNAQSQTRTVYGRFDNSFSAPPGEYTDQVMVTVFF